MKAKKGYILVEGYGEVEAIQNLVNRLGNDVGADIPWAKPRRWPNINQWKANRGGITAGVELVRSKPDAGALLIIRDEDDGCPKNIAPSVSSKLRDLSLPFPVGYVLLHPEYEVFFLPCLDLMGFPPWDRDSWEARRGIKEWLSGHLPRGRSYKPTVDQLPLTRKIELETLREADVPCFGSLERSILFLSHNFGQSGAVYP